MFPLHCFVDVPHTGYTSLITADGHYLLGFTLLIFIDPSVKYLNLSFKDTAKIKSNVLG